MDIDLITLEVVRNRLDSIAQEMELTLQRSAHSAMVKEALDASAAIFDASGQEVAQANALPVHLGGLGPIVRRIIERYPIAEMDPGDAFIMNDPYDGAQHIPDVVIAVPVFIDGKVVAITCSMAHQQDLGGKAPGSSPIDATEIFQEGLIFPPLKLYDRGVPNDTFYSILRKNVRIPDTVVGDMGGQLAAANTGRVRMIELCREYGTDVILEAVRLLQDRSEMITRACIAAIPDGDYTFADYLDNDGINLDKRIRIQATVSIRDSDFHVDFTGTDPQVQGPVNAAPSVALSAVRYVVRVLSGPDTPNNAGCYRPISLHLPPGSLVNPNHPAALNSRAVTLRRCVEVVMGALVQAIPEQISAASNGHPLICSVGGLTPGTGDHWVTVVMTTGGAGAYQGGDGAECIMTDTSNSMNVPIEAMEMGFPLRVIRWGLRPDSGGPGEWRGGLGLEYHLEVLEGEAHFSHRGERYYTAPWGLFGGGEGAMSKADIVRVDGQVTSIPSKLEYDLEKGDRVFFFTTGGGGYGDPLARDPQRVLDDLLDHKLGAEAALRDYGVVVEGQNSLRIDQAATEGVRQQMRTERAAAESTMIEAAAR